MPSIQESNISLDYGWPLGESGWNDELDNNILKIGVFSKKKEIVNIYILTEPPTIGLVNGNGYIVSSTPNITSICSDKANKIAIYDRGSWIYVTPSNLLVLFNKTNGCYYEYNNNAATWSLKTDPDYSNYIKVQGLSFQTC